MQYLSYLGIALMVLLASCTRFEEAELTQRKTFVHFYSSGTNYVGSVGEVDRDGGFIVSGEVRKDNGETDAIVIKTDARGHKIWETVIPGGVVNAILPTENGYVLAGDSIQSNPRSTDVHELVNTFCRLVVMDLRGNVTDKHVSSGSIIRTINNQPVKLNVDYHANAITMDANGMIVLLGSFRVPDENESSFVAAFDPADISDSLWQKSYQSLEHHYLNCNSVFVTPTSSIAWASKMYTNDQSVGRQFLSVPHVAANSAPINHSVFGETDARNHSVEDMQRSPVGYCAVGTYSETTGLGANMYFVRIDANLNILPETARYIDGEILLLEDRILDKESITTSASMDEGTAISATDDGYLLAGTITTTPTVGNGGKDILLVKLDRSGNLMWKKLLGGSGDEVVTAVRQTPDKGFLLFGTNTINGLSSMMMLKTDENGDITN